MYVLENIFCILVSYIRSFRNEEINALKCRGKEQF